MRWRGPDGRRMADKRADAAAADDVLRWAKAHKGGLSANTVAGVVRSVKA